MSDSTLTFQEIIDTISFEDIEKSSELSAQSELMTKEDQQKELARIGRLIAMGHPGYDLWDDAAKVKFEKSLAEFYNGKLENINVKDFCLKLDKVLQKLPDEHLRVSPSKGNLLPR